jgi:hypothetical protein
MRIVDVKQGTASWLKARAGIITASEAGNLVSPTLKVRDGDMPATYAALKIAERWMGFPIVTFGGGAMDQGKVLEDQAVPFYEATFNVDLDRVGFIVTDDGNAGCSPDAVIRGQQTGLEIKCPQPPKHVAYLLGGALPVEYRLQVQFSMWVTGWKEWQFMSYHPDFPPLIVTVGRDEAAMDAISEAVAAFVPRVQAGVAAIEKANGGPRRPRFHESIEDGAEVKTAWEYVDAL